MKELTKKQRSEIEALTKLRDDQIDTSDLPEMHVTDKAVVSKFYRPVKKSVSIRLDADVLEWLKRAGPDYQSKINEILRREMRSNRLP
jgi:uncharacterized protein (DUF4415 family)